MQASDAIVWSAGLGLTILVDAGEVRSGIPSILRSLGVAISVQQLPAGDYQVGPHAVVERKTVADLHRSIATGRLWRQLEKIRRGHDRGWLLIEGGRLDAGQISAEGVRGALLAVIDTGIPLLWSTSPRDSALWLIRVGRRVAAQESSAAGFWSMRSARTTSRTTPTTVLSVVPGISPRLARALLREFGSIEAIAAASPDELRRIDGIGPQRATSVHALLKRN